MSRTLLKALPVVALLGAGLVSMGPRVTGQATGLPSTKNGEWPMYTADLNGSKYSPLDQINAGNFSKLEVAWRLKTDNFGTRPEYKLEATPIMVKGVLYMTAGTRRSVIAVDAKSGEIMWSHSYREGTRAAIAPRQLSGRGASYWTDGKGDERIIYVTTGYRMIALNAKNGQMISSFGTNGVVDLKEGAFFGNRQPIDKETGEIGLHSTPTITKDTIIVGSSFKEGMTVLTHNNTKGLVRAFDVRTGKMIWTFNTIPRPGEFGNDTWENDSWSVNGNTGVWTQISVDEEAGLAYLPVETPTSDFYGGHRHGNNLFAESIVAVDVKTGQRKWHYQLIHHGIWDHDNSSASLLVDATVNGQPRKLLAQPTKQGWLYVFDRLTGQPIWPIEEKPMPASDVPGEKASPTQPIPSRPAPYSRTHIAMDDLIDFTPALRAEALEKLKKYRWEQSPYVPLIMGNVNGRLGTVNIGNTGGWGGAKAYSSYEAAIADPAVDAVVVAVPPKYHLELTLAALAAGKHV
ncbi:MAG TPA: PQQ-binding-like beta-propeller repeat protein, partial [Opitutaceae bacterium]|nr:PQQ-binding-like beta-propeller repeat protein [Opitutaceae bacterium]